MARSGVRWCGAPTCSEISEKSPPLRGSAYLEISPRSPQIWRRVVGRRRAAPVGRANTRGRRPAASGEEPSGPRGGARTAGAQRGAVAAGRRAEPLVARRALAAGAGRAGACSGALAGVNSAASGEAPGSWQGQVAGAGRTVEGVTDYLFGMESAGVPNCRKRCPRNKKHAFCIHGKHASLYGGSEPGMESMLSIAENEARRA